MFPTCFFHTVSFWLFSFPPSVNFVSFLLSSSEGRTTRSSICWTTAVVGNDPPGESLLSESTQRLGLGSVRQKHRVSLVGTGWWHQGPSLWKTDCHCCRCKGIQEILANEVFLHRAKNYLICKAHFLRLEPNWGALLFINFTATWRWQWHYVEPHRSSWFMLQVLKELMWQPESRLYSNSWIRKQFVGLTYECL